MHSIVDERCAPPSPPPNEYRIRSRIASCAASATQTAVSNPPRCKTARRSASRVSFFCRSPLLRGIIEGATAMHASPKRVRVR